MVSHIAKFSIWIKSKEYISFFLSQLKGVLSTMTEYIVFVLNLCTN